MNATPADPAPPPELAWLPVDKLAVDPAYQRTLDSRASQKLIERIAAEFRWASFQAILATPQGAGGGEDGGWLIIDGQHRAEAARRCGIRHIPAVVIAGLGPADQARAFVGANKDRVAVSAQALFHARVVAGDAAALTVKRACDANGIAIERHNKAVKQLAAGHTAGVPALLRILADKGEVILGGAVNAVAECWRDTAGAMSGALFRAAALYLAEGGTIAGCQAAMRRRGIDAVWEANRLGTNSGARQLADAMKRAMPTGAPAAETSKIAAAPARPSEGCPAEIPGPPARRVDAERAGAHRAEANRLFRKPAADETAGPIGRSEPPLRETADNLSGRCFADDPRARRDPGSTERLGRPEPFGRSATGSSLG